MKKKILYIDMDNVLVDFSSGIRQLDQQTRLDYKDRLDEVPGIFGKMLPMENAVSSFNELSKYFDTYILSTSPWENHSACSDKLLWVKRHIGFEAHKRLILTHHKNLNIGDFLVDDRTKNGAAEFGGKLIQFGTEDFPDWISVKKYLLDQI
jgi:5'-nucleotidase